VTRPTTRPAFNRVSAVELEMIHSETVVTSVFGLNLEENELGLLTMRED
jgi:hypothetical protein